MVHIVLLPVLNLLSFCISTFRSAVPSMACFSTSMNSCVPVTFLTYFVNDFEIVPVAAIITGIICFYVADANFYFKVFVLASSRLVSLSHLCFLKLQHLLAYVLVFHYHGL